MSFSLLNRDECHRRPWRVRRRLPRSVRALAFSSPGRGDAEDSPEPPPHRGPQHLRCPPPSPPSHENRLQSPSARPPGATPNGLANRPASIIISASPHAGSWAAARRWLRLAERGPRFTANEDQPHLLRGAPAATVILHISDDTCSVSARGWHGEGGRPSASSARGPLPSRGPPLQSGLEWLFKEAL